MMYLKIKFKIFNNALKLKEVILLFDKNLDLLYQKMKLTFLSYRMTIVILASHAQVRLQVRIMQALVLHCDGKVEHQDGDPKERCSFRHHPRI